MNQKSAKSSIRSRISAEGQPKKLLSILSKKGFTLIEILVALAIIGYAYYATVYTNLGTTRSQGAAVTAEDLQTQLQKAYGGWTACGGTNTGTTTHDIAHEAQFAYDLLTVLGSPAGTNAAAPTYFSTTGVADGSATVLPTSNGQRIQLANTLTAPGTSSTIGVQYGPFYVLFEPSSTTTGIWQVTSTPPVAIP
jgi:prepilin-type N-terminal cleavage/methylation domain-containing protein